MSKTAIVYWSGTGNTEALANKIYESAKSFGKDVQIFTAGEFSEDKVDEFDTVIYGCPSMGCEQLEDFEFEPMFESCKPELKDKALPCSALTAGAAVNGCANGKMIAEI